MQKAIDAQDFPFFKQQKDNECALSCLKMIAAFYGKAISFDYLRSVVPIDPQGISIYNIVQSIKLLDFRSLIISTQHINLLEKATLPCIMLWRNNHYVVIYRIEENKVCLADPDKGLLTLSMKEFLEPLKDIEKEEWIILLEPNFSYP